MIPGNLDPAQCRVLQCPHCLGKLFQPITVGPCLQDRLDPKRFGFTPGPGLVCVGCWKLFDPAVAGGLTNQEISTG